MKKFFKMLALMFVILPCTILLVACMGGKKDPEKPASQDPTYAAADSVLSNVSSKLVEVSNTMVDGVNGTGSSTASASGLMSAQSDERGWTEVSASGYLWMNELSSRVLYAVDYVARNATIINGYANGFDYGNTYVGPVSMDGMEGILYLTSSVGGTDENTNVEFLVNFEAEYEGIDINLNIKILIDYNSTNNKVLNLKMNYIILPFAAELWSVEYDFEKNNFKGYQFYDYTFSSSLDVGTEIVTKYNNGTLDFTALSSYNWTHGMLLSGNITDNPNNLSFNCYEYQRLDEDTPISNIIVKGYYNSLYNSLKGNKLFLDSSVIDKDNAILVNYLQDAVNYGWNKAEFVGLQDENQTEYYIYPFIEYDDMVDYVTKVKQDIDQDQNSDEYIKKMIESAYNFLLGKNANTYTGELGLNAGITTKLTIDYDYDYNNGVYSNFSKKIFIRSNASVYNIGFKVKNNGEFDKVIYKVIPSGKYLYNLMYEKVVEWAATYQNPEYVSFLNGLVDVLNDNKDNNSAITNGYTINGYYIEDGSTEWTTRFYIKKYDTDVRIEVAFYDDEETVWMY